MRLTRLRLDNFKACRHVDLDIAPLTVLIGGNNAGKSSILHSLAFLAQSAALGAPTPKGAMVDLGPKLDALIHIDSAGQARESAELQLIWSTEDGSPAGEATAMFTAAIVPGGLLTTLLHLDERIGSGGGYALEVKSDGSGTLRAGSGVDRRHYPVEFRSWGPWNFGRAFVPGPDTPWSERMNQRLQTFPARALTSFRYVGANRHVENSAVPLGTQGYENPRTAQELVDTLAYRDELLDLISARAQEIFGYGIAIDLIEQRQVTLVAKGPMGSHNVVNLGTGFIQAVWLLTQLELAAANLESADDLPSPLVGIEEPELHIHPGLQPEIARLLCAFVQAGLGLICTTQSEHLLLALLSLVLEGTIPAESIVVYYLRDGSAEKLAIDERGRISGGLRGFFEANEEQLQRHIDLLRQRG